jgi:hypothetical protein
MVEGVMDKIFELSFLVVVVAAVVITTIAFCGG